jgi:DNA-directed RNA polymerase subunit M/transcription elongation factor TFIIS
MDIEIEDEDDIEDTDEEEPDQEDDEGQDEDAEEDDASPSREEEEEEVEQPESVEEEPETAIVEGDEIAGGGSGGDEEEIVVGHENSPNASRLMKRRENKYKFSKQLMSYLTQYDGRERKINGNGNGKFTQQDLQEIRRLVKRIHGETVDSAVFKRVFEMIKSNNEKKAKAKASFIVSSYLDILKEEEEKERETIFLKRFEKDMNDYVEVRDVSEGVHVCKMCGGKKTISLFIQMRSSDEPMSQFITCIACAHRWRIE